MPRLLESLVALRCFLFALPYGDQGLLISRRLYRELGGFRPIPLMEDVDLVRRLKRRQLVMLQSRAVTSGIRLGTPAVTTRGFTTDDCRRVAGYIADILDAPDDETIRQSVAGEVRELVRKFPLPGVTSLK